MCLGVGLFWLTWRIRAYELEQILLFRNIFPFLLYYPVLIFPEATKQIGEIALHINEHMRQHENFQKMLSIQKSFDSSAPKILTPGRIFLKEGPLKKVNIFRFCIFMLNISVSYFKVPAFDCLSVQPQNLNLLIYVTILMYFVKSLPAQH